MDIISLGGNMYKRKDFIWMNVYNLKGKKIGVVTDLLININENYITGFVISRINLLKKTSVVLIEDIISFDNYMIAKKLSEGRYISFNEIRGLDVIDNLGNIHGVVEEIIFQAYDFKIKGLVVSRSIIENFKKGKKIILQQDYIIGDRNILYINKNKKFNFISIFHKLNLEESKHEK